jgi:hypothetical protein
MCVLLTFEFTTTQIIKGDIDIRDEVYDLQFPQMYVVVIANGVIIASFKKSIPSLPFSLSLFKLIQAPNFFIKQRGIINGRCLIFSFPWIYSLEY